MKRRRVDRRRRLLPRKQWRGVGDAGPHAFEQVVASGIISAIERVAEGHPYIAIMGDLNEVPDAAPLAPLIADKVLTDIMAHPAFSGDGRPGTYANGAKSGKIDYILLSPLLSAKVTAGGIERRGVWGGENGTLFRHLDTIQTKVDAASDHAALWADLEV